jgi:hypothetical protein
MKMTIYVSDDLKKKMARVKEANWSALACRAFENHLAELTARKGAIMGLRDQDVITRLRGSKNIVEDRQKNAGFAAGVAWAKSKASFEELQKLEKVFEDGRGEWGFGVGSSAYSAGEQLVMEISDGAERSEAEVCWEAVGGSDSSGDADYVCAFASGAMSVWEKVKDEI